MLGLHKKLCWNVGSRRVSGGLVWPRVGRDVERILLTLLQINMEVT